MVEQQPPVVVFTSDKYIKAVRVYAWLALRYWSDQLPFFVAGFTPPEFKLPANFSFVSIGDFKDYPVDKWSDAAIDFLNDFDHEIFILMLEDYWITRYVNQPAIVLANGFMRANKDVIKFDLCADRFYAGGAKIDFATYGWLDLVLSDPKSAYQMSLMTGMWRKSLLLKVLKRGWSPWDVELAGTTVLSTMPQFRVIGSRQWPIRHTLGFRSGDSAKINLSGIEPEDIKAMQGLGILDPWE